MKNLSRNFLPQLLLVILCIISSCSSISDLSKSISEELQENFIIIDHLNDNEKETRFKWKDLMGKETTLDMDSDERYANSSLKLTSLWQITNGKKFAQLIFSGDSLIDCEFLKDGGDITIEFVDKFLEDYNFIRHQRLDDFGYIKHNKYEESLNLEGNFLNLNSNISFTHLNRLQEIPERFLELMNLKQIQKKCNQLHKQIRHKIRHESEDETEFKVENTNGRTKRQTDNWFIAPGTRWCGSGRSADKYKDLGPSSSDTCCRKHDHCRVTIPGFKTKYGLFNIRPFTISHCRCDRRFRTCLKMADASDANMVGKLFFNIVQIKCFVLKPEKSCILYSWWGKCLKFKTKKKAYLRDNPKY